MKYNKGEKAILYTEFNYNNEIVNVNNPQVRVLHEYNNNVYEDITWQKMNQFDKGYIYTLDTTNLENFGTYTCVFKGLYNEEIINQISSFDLVVTNSTNSHNVNVYGFINDLYINRPLKDTKVEIIDLNSNNIVYNTITDEDGQWESFIPPGEYNFVFSKEFFITKEMRVQLGDEQDKVQFANVGLEKESDKNLGTGMFMVEDTFTTKNNMGIEGIIINVFKLEELTHPFISTTTDIKGKWKIFVDNDTYLLSIKLPTGTERKYKLNVFTDGTHVIEEFSLPKQTKKNNSGKGEITVTDFVINAHGDPLTDITVQVYTEEGEYICEDNTDINGKFELHLDKGKYKFIVSGKGFNTTEQIIDVKNERRQEETQ